MFLNRTEEEKRIVSLKEILGPENIVLIDGSTEMNIQGQESISKQLYRVRSCNDLERIDIGGFLSRIERLQNILKSSGIHNQRSFGRDCSTCQILG